uniref:Uncharacterized protein n=1 Tax=Trypanosoma congolense (strain IL3000) TaxID=1068625 RepID=G0UW55_TRYCI|nr:conserved hypothetical protein [Trypanosoma congolense IL3000]
MFVSDDDDLLPEPNGPSDPLFHEERLRRLEENFAELLRQQSLGSTKKSEESRPAANADSVATAKIQTEEGTSRLVYELRELVPHLSPSFDCSEDDAILLLSAIRRGSVGQGSDTWEERLAVERSEKKALLHQLERKSQECEEQKNIVADLRQRLNALREEAHSSANILSQRREQVRRQLLLEESRSQKLQVRNGQLEQELGRLKDMLHSRMRR